MEWVRFFFCVVDDSKIFCQTHALPRAHANQSTQTRTTTTTTVTYLNALLVAEVGGQALDGDAELSRAFLRAPVERDGVVGKLFHASQDPRRRLRVGVEDPLLDRVLATVPKAPRLQLAVLVLLVAEDDHDDGLDGSVGLHVVRRVLVGPVVDGDGVELALVDVRHLVFVDALGRRHRRVQRVVKAVRIVTAIGGKKRKMNEGQSLRGLEHR